jgi:hypothetical protein
MLLKIKKIKMKKCLLILIIFLLFPVYFFSFKVTGQGTSPNISFEVYDSNCGQGINCTPYPAVWDVQVVGPDSDNKIIITANALDVSGVLSVVAIIETPSGNEKSEGMQYIEGSGVSYATRVIEVEDYPAGTYKVHIDAIDPLLNSSMRIDEEYRNQASFKIGSSENTVELWTDKNEMAWNNSSSPYRVYMWRSRIQFIISASELEYAGLNSGNRITSFFLKASHEPTTDLLDFRIRVKPTTTTVTTTWEGGWTNFFGPANILRDDIVVGEWKEYSFEQGFVWDGESNIMVDISRHHPGQSSWSSSGGIYIRENVGDYRMFKGNCDYCDLYAFSSGENFADLYSNNNDCPALQIKYITN